jgi:cytochrome c
MLLRRSSPPWTLRGWLQRTLGACLLAGAAAAGGCGAAWAADTGATDPAATAIKDGCGSCHASDKKLLGPSYHDIAARYKADPAAAATMATRIRHGSKGVWGSMPMPAIDAQRASDADIAVLVPWILKH